MRVGFRRIQKDEKNRRFGVDSSIQTNNEFKKEVEILLETWIQKSHKLKLNELTQKMKVLQ